MPIIIFAKISKSLLSYLNWIFITENKGHDILQFHKEIQQKSPSYHSLNFLCSVFNMKKKRISIRMAVVTSLYAFCNMQKISSQSWVHIFIENKKRYIGYRTDLITRQVAEVLIAGLPYNNCMYVVPAGREAFPCSHRNSDRQCIYQTLINTTKCPP